MAWIIVNPIKLLLLSGKSMPLTEVEGEHVSKMTDKEKELYDQKYREYCDSIMMWLYWLCNHSNTTLYGNVTIATLPYMVM